MYIVERNTSTGKEMSPTVSLTPQPSKRHHNHYPKKDRTPTNIEDKMFDSDFGKKCCYLGGHLDVSKYMYEYASMSWHMSPTVFLTSKT
jgi:hypothetical protein